MRSFQRLLAGAVGFGFISAVALPASAVVPSAPAVAKALNLARVMMAGVPRTSEPTRDLGRLAPLATITASVMLNYNHEAELESLVEAQADRSSPQFRHFLTSQQFNAYFAPTLSQHAYVIAKLQAAGLRVVQTFSNRTVIDVQGPSGAAEQFFNTEIHSVVQGRYGARFANVKPATLSADLAPLIRSVSLTNFVVARTRPVAAAAAARARTVSSRAGVVNWGDATQDGHTNQKCTGTPENGPLTQLDDDGYTGFLATSIAKAFDFPVQHGCNGAGKTAAIVINGPVLQSDVDLYMHASGVKQTGKLVNIPIDGGNLVVSGEGSLDAETIIGLAPAARVNVYVIPDFSDQHVLDAYNETVSDNTAVDVNSSFGGCESNNGGTGDKADDAVYVQGAALGITFNGTTGDTGSNECNNGPGGAPSLGVSSGNSPHAVAVGSVGFTENSAGKLLAITATAPGPGNDFSGGGVSTVYPLPKYQYGIPNVIKSGRNQPDLSFPGVDVTVYTNGVSVTSGGTSWSGPQFAALLTTGAQLAKARGFGFVNPALYAIFRYTGYTFYYDATSGNNGAYTAVRGYDQVTGIGVPKLLNVLY